jgi:zinc protease
MSMMKKLGSVFFALALLAGCASPAEMVTAQTPAVYELPKGWAKDRSDLPSDPDYTLGQLPNGMRYLILPNKNPPSQIAMRLVINAGSMQERAGEEGVAHFLEHLAFRGTKNYPDGELQRVLEGLGLQMGADANASTGQDRTTFMFNMARNDKVSVDTGLNLLRDIVNDMNLEPALVNAERGVVLAEERTRAGPLEEAQKAFMKSQVGDHPYARSPIGLREVIQTVTPERIRGFYDAFYRPERATLIIVGDVTPDAILPAISQNFADWVGRGEPGKDPQPVMKAPASPDVVVQTTPGMGDTSILLRWFEPYRALPPTKAERRRQLVESLGVTAAQLRMQELIDAAGKPARFASSPAPSRIPNVWSGQMAQSSGVIDAPKTLALMTTAYRQAADFGITQGELDRIKQTRLIAARQAAAAGRQGSSPALADGIANAITSDPMFVSPKDNLALLEEQLKTIQLSEVNAMLKARLKAKPTVIYRGARAPTGGEEALRTAFNGAMSGSLTAYASQAVKPWPYTDFGPAGKVAERTEAADLGVTMVRFENGVRLTVKPFTVRKDQISVNVRLGLGRLGMPRDRIDATDMGLTLWSIGGLGKLTRTEQTQALLGKRALASASTGDDAYEIDNPGGTTPEDFALQMQLMAAMVSDPAYRTDDWAGLMAQADEADGSLELSANGILQRDLDKLLHGGDLRWTINTKAMRDTWKPVDSVAYIRPIVANSPIEVIIVGDISVETAIAETAKTLGALPKRPELVEPAGIRDVKFPPAGNVVLKHKGRVDQGYALVAWPTGQGAYADLKASRIGGILGQMIRDNATRKFRSEGGATYSPDTTVDFSPFLPNYGYIGVAVEVPPEQVADVQASIVDIANGLAQYVQPKSEIDRVVQPLIELNRRQRASNPGYWLGSLAGAQTNPKVLEDLRTEESDYQSITPADVQAAAKRRLKPEAAWKLKVQPE